MKSVENDKSVRAHRKKTGAVAYRFGFNGKENDNDVKGGEGLQQDYGMRVYDNRLGRFLSVDPIMRDYTELTPYQFASNSPIAAIDLDGLEGVVSDYLRTYIKVKAPKLNNVLEGVEEGVDESVQGTWDFLKPNGGAAWKKATWVNTGKNLLAMGFANNPGAALDFDNKFGTDLYFRQSGIKENISQTIKGIPDWDAKDWSKNLTKLGLAILADKGLSKIKEIYLLSKLDLPIMASSNGGLFAKAKDLMLVHSESNIINSAAYKKIRGMTDDELIQSVLNPKNYDPVTINTKTGKVVDGNTRIYEIQRRGLDVEVPVKSHVPDDSAFPELKEPPKKN